MVVLRIVLDSTLGVANDIVDYLATGKDKVLVMKFPRNREAIKRLIALFTSVCCFNSQNFVLNDPAGFYYLDVNTYMITESSRVFLYKVVSSGL